MATPSHAAVERHPVASSPHDAGATATCRSRGTPVWRDPRQGPAQEDDTPTEVRTSAACRPTPRALSPPPVSPSGVVPGVASPTPVSRGSGASSQQGESGTAWGEGHARARGAWGEPQVWSPSHELCAHLPAEPGGRGPPPHGAPARFSGRGAGGASHITARQISPHPLDGVVCGPPRRPTRLTSRKAGGYFTQEPRVLFSCRATLGPAPRSWLPPTRWECRCYSAAKLRLCR